MSKIKAKGWAIMYSLFLKEESFIVSIDYIDENDISHGITKEFDSYAKAYGFLAEKVEL